MAYSVLSIAPGTAEKVLYCSIKQKAILSGSEQEMFDWKHTMEDAEQVKENQLYFDELREQRLALLVSCGHSADSATEWMKEHMPYLFKTL